MKDVGEIWGFTGIFGAMLAFLLFVSSPINLITIVIFIALIVVLFCIPFYLCFIRSERRAG